MCEAVARPTSPFCPALTWEQHEDSAPFDPGPSTYLTRKPVSGMTDTMRPFDTLNDVECTDDL